MLILEQYFKLYFYKILGIKLKIGFYFIVIFISFAIAALAQEENTVPTNPDSNQDNTLDPNKSYIMIGLLRYSINLDKINKGSYKLAAGVYNVDKIINNLPYFYGIGVGYNFEYKMPELDTYIGITYHFTARIRTHIAHDMNKFNFSYTPEIGLGLDRGFAMIGYRVWAINPNKFKNNIQIHFSYRIPFSWYL